MTARAWRGIPVKRYDGQDRQAYRQIWIDRCEVMVHRAADQSIYYQMQGTHISDIGWYIISPRFSNPEDALAAYEKLQARLRTARREDGWRAKQYANRR